MRSRSLSVRAFQIHTPKPRSIQALALGAALAAPLWFSAPAQAQFNDIPPGYWASDYIQALSELEIITGFPDGSFQAEQPVTRAQYAAMVRKAFPRVATVRSYQPFSDVNANFWAAPAIATAYSSGFMSGYPGNEFRANENIPRVQVLVSLANGLGYEPQGRSPIVSASSKMPPPFPAMPAAASPPPATIIWWSTIPLSTSSTPTAAPPVGKWRRSSTKP